MRRFDKKKNIEKVNLLAESRHLENSQQTIKEDEGKVYTDDRTGKTYSSEEVDIWIHNFKHGSFNKKQRESAKVFFKHIGITPKQLKKTSDWISIDKPKVDARLVQMDAPIEWKKAIMFIEKIISSTNAAIGRGVNNQSLYEKFGDRIDDPMKFVGNPRYDYQNENGNLELWKKYCKLRGWAVSFDFGDILA